ncbi:transposase [Enterococcus sp. 10A9_DIV0425]|uniref:Transposase n=1 Tax=Candidatus Enterococcus wittei TaxID=1987383 RepID=A0A242JZX7_9ENTE|nr:ISL3 family transposase [Enterococcus sp. 10A9_DIV0425]OTP10885.1 transposase [Enterococcus sp. 10A9_DIV0425]
MSYTQLIKDTLNILDLNIHFEENCLTKEKYKGQICMIYRGRLRYSPEKCVHCHCVVPSQLIHWGTTTVRLLLNDVSEYRTYLELKKQRFKCKSCHKTFVADTSVAEKHCFISQKVRWSVVTRLKKNTSMTEIAYQKNISVSSVYRIMKKFYRPLNPLKQSLPKTLCFDEFKSVRSVSSAMSFIMMDGDTHELLDILENRRLPYLERYFLRFSSEVREAVQWIVIDMYAPYVSLVKKLFPNAKLIIDRFHIVQHIGRTFRNQRIKETNRLLKHPSSSQKSLGRKLKRYWKLLQKEEGKLDYDKRTWRAGFKEYLTETEIVDRLLRDCPSLHSGYQLYQNLLYAVKKREIDTFKEYLNVGKTDLPEIYDRTLKTFKKFLPQIENALRYGYSNGPLECLNNHIKVLKRNAYGFRSFYNFKLRIMIRHGKALLIK